MALSILIDKSAFQAFSANDIELLYRYYMPNIPPILIMEILGDLVKEFESQEVPAERVQLLANKLLPNNTAVNANYLDLIRDELLGSKIVMDYRPFVGKTILVKSPSGEYGMKIPESPQQIAVRRWKDGHFTKIEELTAQFWRKITKQEDLLEKLKKTIQIDDADLKSIKSLSDANDYVNQILFDPYKQTDLLMFAVTEFGLNAVMASEIFLNWEQDEQKILNKFAPYTLFCTHITLLFHVALKKGLVATRPTNQLDLEYLFYLPFCRIFITNDKFQRSLALLFLTENQSFLDGIKLKGDFKEIYGYIQTVSERKDIIRLQKEPPQIPSLLTYQFWNKFYDWPKKYSHSSAKDYELAHKKMEELSMATETNDVIGAKNSDDLDFVIVESYLRPTDPCPCGSGKQLKDCHMPPEYK